MRKKMLLSSILLIFLLLFAVALPSCKSGGIEDRFAYTKRNFKAEIKGSVDGQEVFAVILNCPDASSDGSRTIVRFNAPDTLKGITVTLSESGSCAARLGDKAMSATWAKGLIEPFLPLVTGGEIYSVAKNDNGGQNVRICDENCDLIFVFKESASTPSHISGKISGREIELEVQNFSFDFDY